MTRWLRIGALVWLLLAVTIIALGQPSVDRKWELRARQYQAKLDDRSAFASPGEVLHFMLESSVEVRVLELRDERDYNLFHLADSQRVTLSDLAAWYRKRPKPNRLVVVAANDETGAVQAWKRLTVMKVPNVYILEGGINGWLSVMNDGTLTPARGPAAGDLAYRFREALGGRHPLAYPSKRILQGLKYDRRVKLEVKARKGGGCG